MAVFGIPVLHEDDALRAVRAAAEMRDGLGELNDGLLRDYGTTLELRIGVNTGEVVTGTEERLATGDAVNVAARLEQAAQPGEMLLGAETRALVRDAVVVEERRAARAEGKGGAGRRLPSRLACAPRSTRRPLGGPMVGRERELARLQAAITQAVAERSCQLFTVLGAAGVGKSRLAFEFLSGLGDVAVVRGTCLSVRGGNHLLACRRSAEAAARRRTGRAARRARAGHRRGARDSRRPRRRQPRRRPSRRSPGRSEGCSRPLPLQRRSSSCLTTSTGARTCSSISSITSPI